MFGAVAALIVAAAKKQCLMKLVTFGCHLTEVAVVTGGMTVPARSLPRTQIQHICIAKKKFM